MNGKHLVAGKHYDIKTEPNIIWEYVKDTRTNYYGGPSYLFRDVNNPKRTVKKSSGHGITETTQVPMVSVPIIEKKSELIKTADYDSMLSHAELVATFLRTIEIEAGVVEVPYKDFLAPTVYVFPSCVDRLQELIQIVNKQKLETKK